MPTLTLLIATSLIANGGLSFQASSQATDINPPPAGEIIFEIPGITCVGRFTDSLKQQVVDPLEGVHGVTFQYLKRDPHPEQMKLLDDAAGKGEFVIGGLGQLSFRVDPEFDSKILIRHLVRSRLYQTDRWMLVERTLLSEFSD